MPANNKNLRLKGPDISQYLFGIQAAPLLLSGVYSLLWPSAVASLPNSPVKGVSMGTIQAMSLTSLSLGAFYAVASFQNNIPMMVTTVPGRLLAAFIFHRNGGPWRSVAPFEGLMGLITAAAVYWGWYSDQEPKRA
ncbi:hypothetical protein ARAM_006684 [Aspergillus rambellii]|uniref:Uncharacterized protein n=2 Tax=Aspergillus subgen. Nidulantes TaxID=2720870 RepID=A0A0F8WD78_9EURO|nr:hypothetical protein ARAM_006684 [Aspergillus rambellii]KKK25577.1 hypothetical protein AOCH_000076 [Aspergillus ochraceoroseus]